MALITKSHTFSAGATIIASEHNTNLDTLYSEINGNLSNANISNSAAIAYSKLNLALGIVNGDISASAAIVASKLDLTSPGGVGTTAPAAGKFTTLEATSTLKLATTNQGDILYDNGTSLVRLTPGTSGQFLKTLGAGANPAWANNAVGYSFISSGTFATTASISITQTVASGERYLIVIEGTTTDTIAPRMSMNSDVSGTDYDYSYVTTKIDGTTVTQSGARSHGQASAVASANWVAGAGDGGRFLAEIIVTYDGTDSRGYHKTNWECDDSAEDAFFTTGQFTYNATQMTSFQLLQATGETRFTAGRYFIYKMNAS